VALAITNAEQAELWLGAAEREKTKVEAAPAPETKEGDDGWRPPPGVSCRKA
jgi:hypothetical protein